MHLVWGYHFDSEPKSINLIKVGTDLIRWCSVALDWELAERLPSSLQVQKKAKSIQRKLEITSSWALCAVGAYLI